MFTQKENLERDLDLVDEKSDKFYSKHIHEVSDEGEIILYSLFYQNLEKEDLVYLTTLLIKIILIPGR